MTPEQDEVVLTSLWKIIKMQHETLTITGTVMEFLFDVVPEEHRVILARRMDVYNDFMNKCDKLITPLRNIMENDS